MVSNTAADHHLRCDRKAEEITLVRAENAAVRVRRRIADWVKREGHGSRKRLAEAVRGLYGKPRSSAWVTDLLDGPEAGGQDLRLRDLDAVAAALKVPPGELVARDDHEYTEVTPSERKLLRYYRTLPAVIQHHMISYLDFLHAAHERELANSERERKARTEQAKRKGIA